VNENTSVLKRGGVEIIPIPLDYSLFYVFDVNDPTVPSSTSKPTVTVDMLHL